MGRHALQLLELLNIEQHLHRLAVGIAAGRSVAISIGYVGLVIVHCSHALRIWKLGQRHKHFAGVSH